MRHALHITKLTSVIDVYKNMRGYATDHLTAGELNDRFREIYKKGVWLHHKDQKSLSGLGSEENSTSSIVHELSAHLKSLNCQTLLDIGCGDFNWMNRVAFNGRYIGIDIVDHVIDQNRRSFPEANREFHVFDATTDPLPKADVILCREVLFHLSFTDAKKLIKNIKSSGANYFIATNEESTWFNSDIRSGDFRMLNLNKRPFYFPKPLHLIEDSSVTEARVLATWSLDELATPQ